MFMRDKARANRLSFRRHADPFDLLSIPDIQQLYHMPFFTPTVYFTASISSCSHYRTPLVILVGRGRGTKTSWRSLMRRSFTTEARVSRITWIFRSISPLRDEQRRSKYSRTVLSLAHLSCILFGRPCSLLKLHSRDLCDAVLKAPTDAPHSNRIRNCLSMTKMNLQPPSQLP